MIIVTGATGHLGRLVIEELLTKVPAREIGAVVRNPSKAADLAARGVEIRHGDYDKPETLQQAFKPGEKVLLISAIEVGKRLAQHRAVLDALKKSRPALLVYTSLLNAETSGMSLAADHWPTEELIRMSGIPFVILRNGWYFENYTENLGPALEHGALLGAAGNGRIAAATRAEYAAAAAAVLTGNGHEGHVYELAGDSSFTLEELAAVVSRVSGKRVVYKNLPATEYRRALVGVGLDPAVAYMLASADQGIACGELVNDSGDLRRLIGRPTMTLETAVRSASAFAAR